MDLASPAGRAEKNKHQRKKVKCVCNRSSSNNSTARPAPFRATRITRLPTLVVFPGEDPHLGRVGEREGKGARGKVERDPSSKSSFGSTVAVAHRLDGMNQPLTRTRSVLLKIRAFDVQILLFPLHFASTSFPKGWRSGSLPWKKRRKTEQSLLQLLVRAL